MKETAQNVQAPTSRPPRHGRRLIQMLFRPGAETAKNQDSDAGPERELDAREEDAGAFDNRVTPSAEAGPTRLPAVTGKFSALKRKLFPSQHRRHPRQVPPLIISPINAPTATTTAVRSQECNSSSPKLPLVKTGLAFDDTTSSNSLNRHPVPAKSSRCRLENGCDQEEPSEATLPSAKARSALETMPSNNSLLSLSHRAIIHDDDDMGLERAVEALDREMESTIADETLAEMDQAIEELQKWKQSHERETEEAMRQLEKRQDQDRQHFGHESSAQQDQEADSEDLTELKLELKRKHKREERDAQALELRRETEAYQSECGLFRTTVGEGESARVEQALQTSASTNDTALSRLRDELLQLDVKQRQAALVQELEDAESAIDMNIVDVQAFTSELDSILAQFDSSTSGDGRAETLNDAGASVEGSGRR